MCVCVLERGRVGGERARRHRGLRAGASSGPAQALEGSPRGEGAAGLREGQQPKRGGGGGRGQGAASASASPGAGVSRPTHPRVRAPAECPRRAE